MCGIAGIVVLRPSVEVPHLALQSMTRALSSRGPDGEGIWVSQNRKAGFGHRRLAIVDLSAAGHQPMEAKDHSAVITFNGEIYNFQSLRHDLEAKGFIFKSNSDTEVLLNLYLHRGEKMVHDLDGDFAFAIWDERKQRIFLARDRAGVKPLYYAFTEDYFVFASDLRAILASGLIEKEVDEQALFYYLTYLVTPSGSSMVRAVDKLETASTLMLDLQGRVLKQKYWLPLPGKTDASFDALDEEFTSLFDDAVQKRLMSDVPVGVLFSGGVDSTLNAGAFGKIIAPNAVDTFTVGMPNTRNDESLLAKQMAAHLGTRHHEVLINDQNVMDHLDAISIAQDEPLSDPVCLPLYFVSQLARRDGVIVLQAGEGADELFCGYPSYAKYMHHYNRYWKPASSLPRAIPQMAANFLADRGPNAAVAADVLSRMAQGKEFFMSSAIGFYDIEKAAVLEHGYNMTVGDYSAYDVVEPYYELLKTEAPDATFLQKMTFIELNVRLPELLLMRVDRMAMAHGLEVRVPFLDHRLIEFAMRVPDAWKLRNGIGKEPVKRLAATYAPHDLIYKPKQGFGAPLQQWFEGPLKDRLRDMLLSDSYGAARHFNLDALRARLDAPSRTTRQAFQLWVIYNFLLWKKNVLEAS